MNLATTYLGLKLKNPLMPGASPMVNHLDNVRRLEDAGASAIVMHSLFEEQVRMEEQARHFQMAMRSESSGDAVNYFPDMDDFPLAPDQYLERIVRIRGAVEIPVIGSLNGVTPGGWVEYARMMQQAGAHALELNFYELSAVPANAAVDVEIRAIETLQAVKEVVRIPVAVKLSPFFSSLPNFASELVDNGADGLIFFNRFYQPGINIGGLEVEPALQLSDPSELCLRLHWLAIVSACVKTSYAASGGVHSAHDVIKAVMAGADAVQMVSILLKRGPDFLKTVLNELECWLLQHDYESLTEFRGCMSLEKTTEPSAFERAGYHRMLRGWRA